jgi:hypothetical protein
MYSRNAPRIALGTAGGTSLAPWIAQVAFLALDPGTSTATVAKAATANYNSASAVFSVAAIPAAAPLAAWIGANDTRVSATTADTGVGLFRSTADNCVLADYAACLTSDGKQWSQLTLLAPFAGRFGRQLLPLSGQLWLVGGGNVNGVNWPQATAAAGFPGRTNFAAASFNNLLWVIAAAPVTARSDMQAIVLNDQLCIVGAKDGTRTHDTWCSPDGVQWRLGAAVDVQL